MSLQSLVHAVYPAQCVSCDALTAEDHGLCATCWRETRFADDSSCSLCAAPVLGGTADALLICDDCLQIARPWSIGRAALLYEGVGRKLVLALKHGDRTELAVPAAKWMARYGRECLEAEPMIVPIPLHWSRFLYRRYNQAALLASALSQESGSEWCPDVLYRPYRTKPLEGHSRDQRFAAMQDAIRVHPDRKQFVEDRIICLIDDVMTSGATLASATEALKGAGAKDVRVLVLARVAKDA